MYCYNVLMNKSVIFSLFLMASLLVGTSLNTNMFPTAMASGKDKDDKRYDYDNKNRYQQSTYEQEPYANSYSNSYNYDEQPSYNNGYDKSSYFMDSYGDRYNDHKDKIYKYECRTGPFEGFFVSSVEFCDAKNKFNDDNKVKIFPPDGLLTADWWKWIIPIPSEISPLLDETGDNCDVNQQGPVWFLVGTPGDTTIGNLTTGDAERDCVIPEGKKILFPIINTFCSELNDQISGPQLEEGLRQCAEDIINEVDILEASIDGKSITNFEKFRVQSPLFTISIPEDNAFGITNFTNIPQKAISDGYWVEVKGLDPGEHTIEFTGGATAFSFTTHVLYHITIEPTNNNDNNYYDNSY